MAKKIEKLFDDDERCQEILMGFISEMIALGYFDYAIGEFLARVISALDEIEE